MSKIPKFRNLTKSEQILIKIPPKNITQDSIIYLKGKYVLVIVGRDSDEYKPQAREIVNKLKKRLNLSEI
ncbi:hypothetical protein A3A52_05425 [Candidatus Woesebacteria bacterium RIFCSPLOWO2_01_FULL_39_14]|uniref:Uncharacterized protein n=1 Tax=Candidatus Woesebacteria bacterium RIFCSPLOWO2_01_FULL_39_14 TaxID=1802518 RepID=A0A1F8BJV3_9BACT|nr:MAG: hypothetical protein A3A52_05425 [Candidatus Woesebacteria bacterium RIFCSPLOWO2_01_FULL_39_14]